MKILKKLYGWLNFLPKNSFKIVEITGSTQTKNSSITYQVCGTSTTTTEKPEAIVDALMEIKGFSKEDSQLIYRMAITEKQAPNLKITNIVFDENQILFEIEDIQLQSSFKLPAEEIINSQVLINSLSVTDVIIVHFQYIKKTELENKLQKKPQVIQFDRI